MRIQAKPFGQRTIPAFWNKPKGEREHDLISCLRDMGWPLEHDDTRPVPKQIGDALRKIGAQRLNFRRTGNNDMILEWE
jgi:hypothetical protein